MYMYMYICIVKPPKISGVKQRFCYAHRFCGSGIWKRKNNDSSLFLLPDIIWRVEGWMWISGWGRNHMEVPSFICLTADTKLVWSVLILTVLRNLSWGCHLDTYIWPIYGLSVLPHSMTALDIVPSIQDPEGKCPERTRWEPYHLW